MATLLLVDEAILLIIVVDVQAKTSWVDVLVAPDEEGTEDRLREQVENT